MNTTYTYTTKSEDEGMRVDKIFAQNFPELSRSYLQKNGLFSLEDNAKSYKTKAHLGETWTLKIEKAFDPKTLLTPWDHPLEILKETDSWVAISKPIGLSVHPSASEKSHHTIVNALLHYYGKDSLSSSYEEVDGVIIPRLGIVHRLDKPTSGVLLVAKDNQTHKKLQENWSQTQKIYYAIVDGLTPKKGHIEGALIRDRQDKIKMKVSRATKAKEAQTSFETIESYEGKSLLKVQIHTGRTHQIRVHLSSIGFPILGDNIYGKTEHERLMLHAHQLTFPDPQNSEKVIEIIDPLPKAFQLVKKLKTS